MSTDASVSSGGGGGGSTGVGGVASTGGAAPAGGGSSSYSWGQDWRKQIAGGDEQELKRLERFQGPENIYKSYREIEAKLSAGDLVPTLKKDATVEETSRFRKAMGVPDKPEGYKVNMPDGQPAPKDDDEFLGAFLKSAHDAHYTQGQVDQALASFYSMVGKQVEGRVESEKAMAAATEETLRADWGVDYRANKAMAEALLARAPSGFRDRFMNGYLSDDTPISASPEAWKWLVQMEREINPAATVMPGAGGDLGKSVEAEILELKKEMANSNGPYWKGPEAAAKQQRYRDLLNANEKIKARATH